MESILQAILGNDNTARAAAEQQFDEFKRTHPRDALSQLSAILHSSTNESFRSLAAIILRGIVLRESEMWGFLTAEEYEYIRNQLLESLMNENLDHLQRKIANTIASHAKLSIWPALMQGIVQLSQSANMKHHELCLFLLDKLAENIGPLLISNLDLIMNIILPFLLEKNFLRIRIFATQALCSVLFEVPDINKNLCDFLNHIPSIIMKGVEEDIDESLLQDMLGNICRLAKEKSEFFFNSWEQLFSAIFILCGDDRIVGGSRVIALDIVITLLTSKKSSFCSTEKSRKDSLHLCMKLMTAVEDDDDAISSNTRPESEESGFGDVDGDGNDGNISDFSAVCLDTLSKSLEPSEVLQVCMSAAWSLVSQDDWRARRAALLVVSIICEGVRDCLYPHLSSLVPTAVHRVSDPHPRVRFVALHCLEILITEFTGDENEDENENDVAESSFQELFKNIPTVLCQSVRSNAAYPRILYGSLSAIKTFFNPDVCTKKICLPYGNEILDISLALFQNSDVPFFVRAECASVIGNVSILYSAKITKMRYESIMEILKKAIFSILPDITNEVTHGRGAAMLSHEFSLLKAKSLESVALVGKAVGREMFHLAAHEFLAMFVESHRKGLDFSDPLSSYIVQSCARIASVIGGEFQPYVAHFIPPLLNRINQGLNVVVSDENNCVLNSSLKGAENGTGQGEGEVYGMEVHTLYKRGIGNVNVTCNTYEIGEKETVCRCLYQYCHDIPEYLWTYALDIVRATSPLLESGMHKSENLFIIVGAILVESLKMFLLYSAHPSQDESAALAEGKGPGGPANTAYINMTNSCLNSFKIALKQIQFCLDSEISMSLIIVEGLNDALKTRLSATNLFPNTSCWFLGVPLEEVKEFIILLRDMSILFVQKRFLEQDIPAREEDEQTEDDLWAALMDAIGFFVKLMKDDARDIVKEELLPFIQGLLNNDENPTLLMQFPICVLRSVIEHVPSLAEECCTLLAPSLIKCIAHPDNTLSCISALGVCAMFGGQGFDSQCGSAVTALLAATGADSSAQILDPDSDLDPESVKDTAHGSLFRISVYRSNALQGASTQLLQHSLRNLPLTGDVSEARDIHRLFVDLVAAGDPRLLGSSGLMENLSQVLFVLAQLAAIDDECRIEKFFSGVEMKYDEEFWDKQVVCVRTLRKARLVIKQAFSHGVPRDILLPAVESLPYEVQCILNHFSS